MNVFKKIFGTSSQREVKAILPLVNKIEGLEEEYKALTDAQLQAKTPEFQERYKNGESLDDLLPEAFATVREASKRTMGMRHFDVQLIGAMALHEGHIAEMKTGEGKTLVSTLAGYLNAIAGKGVHVVTVNDYLAKRDSEWMAPTPSSALITCATTWLPVPSSACSAATTTPSSTRLTPS